MSDEITIEARMAVAAAFAFAGPKGNTFESVYRTKLNDGVLRAAAAMNGKLAKIAQEVLDSNVFVAEYLGYELEESSQRLKVRLRSETTSREDDDGDGSELIRTERTDNAFGKAIKERLDELKPGSTILVFKYIEHMEGRGAKDKVRILKHFEVLAGPKDSTSSGPASAPSKADSPPSAVSQAVEAPPVPESSAAKNDADPFDEVSIANRVQALGGPRAAAFAKRCRSEGVTNFIQPGPDEVDRVLVWLMEAEKE